MKKLLTKARRWSRQAATSAVLTSDLRLRKEATTAREQIYVGHIDRIGNGSVAGWAASRKDLNSSIKIRIYLDAVLSAEGLANAYRPDLTAAGYGNGQHGYELPVPKKALMCATHMVLKVVVNDDLEVVCEERLLRQRPDRKNSIFYMDASDLIEFLTHYRELSGIQRVQAGYLIGIGNTVIAGTETRICTRFRTSSFFFDVPYDWLAILLSKAGDASVTKDAWITHIASAKASLTRRSELVPGDTIFTMGAPWALDDHNETIRCAKLHDGVHYVQIFYDLIPISAPEVVAAPLIPPFARAMAAMSIYADHIFSISMYSQNDLINTLKSINRQVPPTSLIPMGGSITDAEQDDAAIAVVDSSPFVEGPFVLCVGTLEPRKNHMLLLQVWRLLVARHGANRVPKLVLVGRIGWYMEEFVRQLKATDFAERTIIHLEGISNKRLSQLYNNCLFTIFPSFIEGWGLPITESLARGKICVCSNTTSMPEAGGSFVQYIDPYNVSEASRLCEALIFDDNFRAQCEETVRSFTPSTWADASQVLCSEIANFINQQAVPGPFTDEPIEFGRSYRFDNIEATSSGSTAKQVFCKFLQQEDALNLLVGWNWFQPESSGTWSSGSEIGLRLNIPPYDGSVDAYIGLVIPPAFHNEPWEVYVANKFCGKFQSIAGPLCINVPLGNKEGNSHIRIIFIGSRRMQEDNRLLGFGLTSITIYRQIDTIERTKIIRGGFVEIDARS